MSEVPLYTNNISFPRIKIQQTCVRRPSLLFNYSSSACRSTACWIARACTWCSCVSWILHVHMRTQTQLGS